MHSQLTQPPHEATLRHIDPKRARARSYHLRTCRSLFGEPAILITWGRIGRRPRVRLETFASPVDLEARWCELLARRGAHGYTTTDSP